VEKAVALVPLAALLLLGVWIPGYLREMIEAAAAIVKGGP